MSDEAPESYWERTAICVAAADGDAAALAALTDTAVLRGAIGALRLGPALALACERLGVEPSVDWRRQLQSAMTGWLLVDRMAQRLAAVLGAEDVLWAPLKGYDVGTRFYDPREARPTGDLDVLVARDDLGRARRALEAAGWSGVERSERSERYLRDEGYAWQARDESGALLEVHFRLWGLVPAGFEQELLTSALPDRRLGASARRLRPAHAFVLASIHGWTQEPPRSLRDWRDLERIVRSESEEVSAEVVRIARGGSLELPVALSAAVVERLWPSGTCREILAALAPELARGERRLVERLAAVGIDGIAWSRIVLARLLAGRQSRAGWRSVWRQLWAHPAAVEQATPGEWWWPRRRLHHLRSSLGRR